MKEGMEIVFFHETLFTLPFIYLAIENGTKIRYLPLISFIY